MDHKIRELITTKSAELNSTNNASSDGQFDDMLVQETKLGGEGVQHQQSINNDLAIE